MPSETDRAFTANSPKPDSESAITPSERQQPMQIYRPEPSPLPGNRPIAENVTDEMDDMLGYLD